MAGTVVVAGASRTAGATPGREDRIDRARADARLIGEEHDAGAGKLVIRTLVAGQPAEGFETSGDR